MSSETKYKRKRKTTFLQNAKKYAKKGYYGRGSHVDADMYQYFVQIMETFKRGFEADDEKAIFVNQVFETAQGKEIECSCNQVGCRVIETLLPFANDTVLKTYMEKFSSDFRPLCSDRFASHVLEALVTEATKRTFASSISEDMKENFKSFVLRTSKFLLNNLEDYIWDTYGNHIIRTCLENLSKSCCDDAQNYSTDTEYKGLVLEYGQRLIVWPQFNELCYNELTSGFLQVLLKTLKTVDKKLLKKYLDKVLTIFNGSNEVTNSENVVPEAFYSKPVIMLLEASVQLAPKKKFSKIYVQCFYGRLVKLATMKITNFAVQKLITSCTDKVEFEAIFDELCDSFLQIVESGHSGVILSLAQTCKRLGARQGSFTQKLMEAFDCHEPEERNNYIVYCLSKFKKYGSEDNSNGYKGKLNLHGTLILQVMLEFNKPIGIINSILNMEAMDLKDLFSNAMGSHIVDSYVKSTFVGEKSREKLVRKMKGTYQELASSRYGSRAFEAIWSAANIKAKLQIMDELCYKDATWSNTQYGKIIASKTNLQLYKRNKEEWKNSLNKAANDTKELFKDVLE